MPNVVDIKANLPLQILPGLVFRAAEQEERVQIMNFVAETNPYGDDMYAGATVFVIAATMPAELTADILDALLVHEKDLGITLRIEGVHTAEVHVDMLAQAISVMMLDKSPTHTLDEGDAKELAELHSLIGTNRNAVPQFARALSEFRSIGALPWYSPLRILAYFAIIESILARKPRPTDPSDSIGRQIRGKVTLLGRRFATPVDDKRVFPGLDAKAVWDKLYTYRSDIAHGNEPDFKKNLRGLVDPNLIHDFLRTVTRRLLAHCLREPILVRDLYDC